MITLTNIVNKRTPLQCFSLICDCPKSIKHSQKGLYVFDWMNNKNRYNYISPIDKPISSVAINSIIQLSTQAMSYGYFEWNSPAQISIILGGIAFRHLNSLKYFHNKNSKNIKLSNAKERWIYKIIQKCLMVDLQRDVKFYKLSHRQNFFKTKYYKASYLFKNMITSYLILNFFRGCYSIVTEPQFNSMLFHTFSVTSLSSYDPYFICPIASILLTYFLISKSRHPIFLHLLKPQNFLHRFNIAFMSGLLFVPLPTIYIFGYYGICIGHLMIRWLRYQGDDIKEQWRILFGKNLTFQKSKELLLQKAKKQQPENKRD